MIVHHFSFPKVTSLKCDTATTWCFLTLIAWLVVGVSYDVEPDDGLKKFCWPDLGVAPNTDTAAAIGMCVIKFFL